MLPDTGENQHLVECIGCAIGRGEVEPPGGIIKETGNFVLHQDPAIPIPGFLIVASKDHIQSLSHLDRDMRYEMIDLLHEAVSAVKASGVTERVTIIQDERSAHFHVWVFPYMTWMERYFSSVISEYRDISKAASEVPELCGNEKDILDTVEVIRKIIAKKQA